MTSRNRTTDVYSSSSAQFKDKLHHVTCVARYFMTLCNQVWIKWQVIVLCVSGVLYYSRFCVCFVTTYDLVQTVYCCIVCTAHTDCGWSAESHYSSDHGWQHEG